MPVEEDSKKMHGKTVADCSIHDIHSMIIKTTVHYGDEGKSISLGLAKIVKLLSLNDFVSVLNFVEKEMEAKFEEQGYQTYSPRYFMDLIRGIHAETMATMTDEAIDLYEDTPNELMPVIRSLTTFGDD